MSSKPKTQHATNSRKKATVQLKHKSTAKKLVLYTCAILILFLAIFMINRANGGQQQKTARLDELPSIVNQPVIGSEQAKITIIEFGDYKCPSCKLWSENIYPELKTLYIDSGQVKLAFINTLFHGEESRLGAIGGEAVFEQSKNAFWEFNKAMFDAQPNSDHESSWITVQKITEIAKSISTPIDVKRLTDDVTNRTTAPQVNIDMDIVEKYQINQTPTLLINGIKVGNPFDLNEIKVIIDSEISGDQHE